FARRRHFVTGDDLRRAAAVERDAGDGLIEGLPYPVGRVGGGALDDEEGVARGGRHLAEVGLKNVQPAQDAPGGVHVAELADADVPKEHRPGPETERQALRCDDEAHDGPSPRGGHVAHSMPARADRQGFSWTSAPVPTIISPRVRRKESGACAVSSACWSRSV